MIDLPRCSTFARCNLDGQSSRLAVVVAWIIRNKILAPHALRSMIGTAEEERCTNHQTPGMPADAVKTSWKADIIQGKHFIDHFRELMRYKTLLLCNGSSRKNRNPDARAARARQF